MPDQDPQQLSLRFEQAQRELQLLDRHLAGLEQMLAELQEAKATLDGLQGDTPLDTLVPIGGGIRIPARIDPTASAFVDLGAGYATEASLAEARSRITDRIQSTESAFRATSQEVEKVARTAQALAQRLSTPPRS